MTVKQALLQPAYNLSLSGLISLTAAFLLVLGGFLVPSRALFLIAATLTILCALFIICAGSRAERQNIDVRIFHALRHTGFALGTGSASTPSTLAVLLYSAGFIGCIGAYSYLALTSFGALSDSDENLAWGLVDKRPLIFGYVLGAIFISFHWLMVRAFFNTQKFDRYPRHAGWETTGFRPSIHALNASRLLGGVVIAFLAYWWICLPALRDVDPSVSSTFAPFYSYYSHIHVHLGALEQIRLGAIPALEAQTQYGLGNQVLMYFLTQWLGFSSHGFYAANILLNAICTVGFFVVLQRFLGFAWALAGLLGWMLWPSPYQAIEMTGWAFFTRWLAIPILSLWLAHLLLNSDSRKRMTLAPLLSGALWGIGGFLSQENLSGGGLVFALCIALFGPTSGLHWRAIARFSALFVAGGLSTFLVLVANFVGISRLLEFFRMANVKSNLVIAGVSNSWWSDKLELSVGLGVADGRPHASLASIGEWAAAIQTYGCAFLLIVSIGLLAAFFSRRASPMTARERQFIRKFGGVAVGAFVLHLFTLMRSDFTHLAGPSFLLALFLAMLPMFVWRFVPTGFARNSVWAVSVMAILAAALAGGSDIGRKIAGIDALGRDSRTAFGIYAELLKFKDQSSDLASRYSPIPRFQPPFRNHPDYADTQELFGLLHDRLRGRRLELGFHKLNGLIPHAELFYFFGKFRSISGITSSTVSIWLRSEEDAWVDRVVGSETACVFFEPVPAGRLFEAWQKSVQPLSSVVTEPIVGRKNYGVLSCRT